MNRKFARAVGLAIFVAAALLPGLAQGPDDLGHDLSNHYVGRSFQNFQPYLNREVWFDREGKVLEKPTPVCTGLYGVLEVSRIRTEGSDVIVEASRHAPPSRSRSGEPAPWPSYASRDVTLRFRSPDHPWTIEDFDRAFAESLKPRQAFDLYPPGATPPPQETDRRIAYFLNGVPVYHPGNGVTPPKAIGKISDADYSEAARRAHAGGSVLLRFIVNEDGSVSNVQSGQPPLGYGLDEASVRTAQRWRFQPGTFDGRPVKVELRAGTDFCLY